VADLDLGRVTEADLHERGIALYFQYGDVRGLVTADDFRFEIAAILQRYSDFARILDHVSVGDDVARLGVENDAGARTLKRPLARTVTVGRDIEEATEEGIVEERILRSPVFDRAARGNVHHSGGHFLHDRRQRRHGSITHRSRHGGGSGRSYHRKSQ